MHLTDLVPPVPHPQPWPPIRWWPPIEPYAVGGARSWWGAAYAVIAGWRELQLDLHVPANATAPVPVVVWVHGGGFSTGARWRMPLQWPQGSLFEACIRAGLAVATVDYRHDAEGQGIGAAVRDARAAIRYLRHYAGEFGIDPGRVGIWGESAGGHVAALAGLLGDGPGRVEGVDLRGADGVSDQPSSVQAVVDWYGPYDIGALVTQDDAAALGTTCQGLTNVSPSAHVPADGSALPPFLLVHGTGDRMVPYAQSERIAADLAAVGATCTLVTVPDVDHVFIGTDPVPLMEQSAAWLRDRLLEVPSGR